MADVPATIAETLLLATLIRAAVMTALDARGRIAARGNGAMRQLPAWRKRGEVMDVIAEAGTATLS